MKKTKKKLKLTIVDFTCGGDGQTALYINGKLETYGDYYHNHIDDYIEGFESGLKYCDIKFKREMISCNNEGYKNCELDIPNKFKKIDFTETVYE